MGKKKDNKKDKRQVEYFVEPAPEPEVPVEVADPGKPKLAIVRAWRHGEDIHFAVDYGATKLRRCVASDDENEALRKLLVRTWGL